MSGRRPVVRLGGQELPAGPLLEAATGQLEAERKFWRAQLAPLPPAAERGPMLESVWQDLVIRLAQRLGFYVYHPHLSKWSARGWPDLSLLGSRALWIECKSDTGQLTAEQADVIMKMRSCGLEVYVLRPWHGLDEVVRILQWTP